MLVVEAAGVEPALCLENQLFAMIPLHHRYPSVNIYRLIGNWSQAMGPVLMAKLC